MKIVPLAPSGTATYRNLVKWSRRLKISIFLQQYNINKIVLIGNGTPDDIVLMILLSKFNGKAFTDSLIGITKSGRLWIESILSGIDIVDKTHGKVKCLLIIIDQEKMSLRDIWMQIHEKISERASCSIVNDAKRLRVLNCSRGIYNFNFIITINGLDITQYCSHTIEDHLLEIAKDVSGAERISRLLAESDCDPKTTWSKLSKQEQLEVYRRMTEMPIKRLRRYFKQHIKAIETLEKLQN